MAGQSDTPADTAAPDRQPVSRLRRAIFTYCVVAACITLSFILAIRGVDTKVAQVVADGLITFSMWLGIAYVGASSVDYSLASRLSPLARLMKRGGDDDDDDAGKDRKRNKD